MATITLLQPHPVKILPELLKKDSDDAHHYPITCVAWIYDPAKAGMSFG